MHILAVHFHLCPWVTDNGVWHQIKFLTRVNYFMLFEVIKLTSIYVHCHNTTTVVYPLTQRVAVVGCMCLMLDILLKIFHKFGHFQMENLWHFSEYVILCGWLGSKYQLTNTCALWETHSLKHTETHSLSDEKARYDLLSGMYDNNPAYSELSPDVIRCGWLGLKHQLTKLFWTSTIGVSHKWYRARFYPAY